MESRVQELTAHSYQHQPALLATDKHQPWQSLSHIAQGQLWSLCMLNCILDKPMQEKWERSIETRPHAHCAFLRGAASPA